MSPLRITVGVVALLSLASCGPSGSRSGVPAKPKDYTLEQMDSIGKAFKPEIGRHGGALRLSLDNNPNGFCVATANSGYSMELLGYIYEGLITLDMVTLEHKLHIAKSWEVSPDGLHWTFHLRDDVLFNDGVKLSAYDVTFTFNDVIYNKKINAPVRDNFMIKGRPVKVTAPDSHTVVFDLPAPFAPFLTVVGMSIMPRHRYAKQAADGTLESFLGNGVKPQDVVGSGPFMLEKAELGVRFVLKRNPHYWKRDAAGNRLPYLDQIVYTVIKEPNTVALNFQKGELDHAVILGENYPIVKPLEKQGNFTVYRLGPRWYDPFFVFNQNSQVNPKTKKPYLEPRKQKWFRNTNFRKACAYAVNYPSIIEVVYNGLAYPPAGVWGPHKGFFSNPDAVRYSYRPDTARALLAAEGYKDTNGDGFVEDPDGNTVEFTLMTSDMQLTRKMYEMVRKDLELVGLKVHTYFAEFNLIMDKTQHTFDWDVVAFSMGGIMDPHFGKSSEIYTSFRYIINPGLKAPSYPWEQRIADIFEQAVSEMDPNKRKALYGEWQAIVQDQCTHVYMPLREVIVGVSNRLGNIHLTKYLAMNEAVIHNVDEIYLKDLPAAK